MNDTRNPQQTRKRRWPQVVVAIVIVLIILLLLLLRGCHRLPIEKFDYFRAKARELGDDPARMLSFVKELPTLSYRGDVKGPLATLWNGAGSPEEKKALAEALLATGRAARSVTVEEVAAGVARVDSLAVFKLTITHRAVPGDGAARETLIAEAPIGAFVGDVHTIETPAAGKTRFTIRGRAAASKEVSVEGAVSEEVVFTFACPDRPEPVQVVRELWNAQNRTGAAGPLPGDRHDFVVLPCRTTKYVRAKEELILKEHDRSSAAEAKPYLTLLDYARLSDDTLASLEKKQEVRARFDMPRILVLSRWPAPEIVPARVAQALDLRWNALTFEGDPIKAYQAQQVRSFTEAGLEQQFLMERTGVPCTSAFDVLSRMKDDLAANPRRRLETIDRALAELLERGGGDAQAYFTARDPRGAKRDKPAAVMVTRGPGGSLHVKSGPIDAAFAKKLAETPEAPKLPIGPAGLEGDFPSSEEAASAVETALLGALVKPSVEPNYVLETKLARGAEPLVCKGAVFELAWGQGETRTEQRVKVVGASGALELKWKVQDSALPVAGKRVIEPGALDGATVHNPWYRAGASSQADATSFVVSRKVFAALKAGKPSPFALWAKLGPDADEKADRKLEWQGEITPAGAGSVTVKVNGKPEKLALVKAMLRGSEVALLDDAVYPVGMADKLVSVATAIRGKLVDERDLPIAGARVTIADTKVEEVTTSVDGAFRLPPAPGGGYGPVVLHVVLGANAPVDVPVDLTAPGLSEVLVKTQRPRPELAYITQTNAELLGTLPLSDQVKRNAKRDLDAGRMVVIPTRMIQDGGKELIGYFACDRETGYLVGITEDGLCGSNVWERAVESAIKDVNAARKAQILDEEHGASGVFHAYRGALISFWVYCNHRMEGMTHKEAIIQTLEDMDMWADNLDLTHFANKALEDAASNALEKKAADKLGGMLTDLVGKGIVKTDDDAAKAAFKIGYLGGTLFLAKRLEDSDYDD